MIGACDFQRLLLRKDILCSLAKGVAALPPHTNKALAVRHCSVSRIRAGQSALKRFPGTLSETQAEFDELHASVRPPCCTREWTP